MLRSIREREELTRRVEDRVKAVVKSPAAAATGRSHVFEDHCEIIYKPFQLDAVKALLIKFNWKTYHVRGL